ncbi:MAG: hypothetical protein U0324_46715 [Polyangiales bacterium]
MVHGKQSGWKVQEDRMRKISRIGLLVMSLSGATGSLGCGDENAMGPSTTRGSCVLKTTCIDYWNQTISELETRRQSCPGRWMAEHCLSDPAVGGCVTDRTTTWFYRDASGNPTFEWVLQTCGRSAGVFLPPR